MLGRILVRGKSHFLRFSPVQSLPIAVPLPVDLSGIRLDARQGLARQFYEGLRERILDAACKAGHGCRQAGA